MSLRFDPDALKRIVIKIGSSSIVKADGEVRLGFLGAMAAYVSRLNKSGTGVVIVTSGAIALGRQVLGFPSKPSDIPSKQACAACGQNRLMGLYQRLFDTLSTRTAQILVNRDDVEDRRRYLNAREAVLRLLKLSVVPIVNENDTTGVEEIQFGDNDSLSALVAGLIDADLLILLTDVEGLYSGNPSDDPEAQIIPRIDGRFDELYGLVRDKENGLGSGGMRSKLEAARLCRQFGIPCIITRGSGANLKAALAGEETGTYVAPLDRKPDARRRWLSRAAAAHGTITVDAGARAALVRDGKSLLPKGVIEVKGDFTRGQVAAVVDPDGVEIARGVVRYRSEDLRLIAGRPSSEIESLLGFTFGDEVIHRDDLAITGQ